MNPNRMSIEELLELKPSMDNPIELVCDDGYYEGDLYKIKIVAVYEKDVCFRHKSMLVVWHCNFLRHYPSFDQPKKRNLEVFYECLEGYNTCFKSETGKVLEGIKNGAIHFLITDCHYPLIPNGRKLIYDHDNKELLAWDEGLMK